MATMELKKIVKTSLPSIQRLKGQSSSLMVWSWNGKQKFSKVIAGPQQAETLSYLIEVTCARQQLFKLLRHLRRQQLNLFHVHGAHVITTAILNRHLLCQVHAEPYSCSRLTSADPFSKSIIFDFTNGSADCLPPKLLLANKQALERTKCLGWQSEPCTSHVAPESKAAG